MTDSAAAMRTDPTQSFLKASSWERLDERRFRGEVDPVWAQGRAVYGGVVGAGLARAMRASAPTDSMLRSFCATFAGPVESGVLTCTTEVLRAGRSATFVGGRVVQGETARATATATFGTGRDSAVHRPGKPRPDVPGPDGLQAMPYLDGLMPKFQQRLELRWTHGQYPFSGADGSTLGGWCRFRDDSIRADASGLLALIDAWPAPALQNLETFAAASSMTWSVDFFNERADALLDEWWYFDAATVFTADGYTSFEASLWAPDGQYVARSCQLVGVFG